MINERLRKIREYYQMNQREFSEKINVGQSTLAMFENGQRSIKEIHIAQICNVFNISEIWLKEGKGDMFSESSTFSLDDFAKANNITSLEKDIIKIFMELDSSARKDLLNKMKVVFAKHLESESTLDIRPQPVAAHNDAELDDEELKRMREDLEEL